MTGLPPTATLFPYTTLFRSSGVATFSNLSINKTGTGYTLAASDGSLTGTTSSAFNITPATADHLAFGTQPTNTVADRKSTRLNSSHTVISYAGFCLKKKTPN